MMSGAELMCLTKYQETNTTAPLIVNMIGYAWKKEEAGAKIRTSKQQRGPTDVSEHQAFLKLKRDAIFGRLCADRQKSRMCSASALHL
jgi:hypothetical protein